jgi:hypothetical protein
VDVNGTIGVGFGGGEPTRYRRFVELCAYSTLNTGLAVTFTTHDGLLKLKGNVHFIRNPKGDRRDRISLAKAEGNLLGDVASGKNRRDSDSPKQAHESLSLAILACLRVETPTGVCLTQ